MHGIVQEQLTCSRMTNSNRSSVTYDLTECAEYLTPKELGLALSEVFFENDGAHWFSVEGKSVHFKPNGRVKMLFPQMNQQESRTTMCYFSYNLENEIIPRNYAEQLKGSFDPSFGLVGRTRESIYSEQLKNNIMEYIDVEYLQ